MQQKKGNMFLKTFVVALIGLYETLTMSAHNMFFMEKFGFISYEEVYTEEIRENKT